MKDLHVFNNLWINSKETSAARHARLAAVSRLLLQLQDNGLLLLHDVQQDLAHLVARGAAVGYLSEHRLSSVQLFLNVCRWAESVFEIEVARLFPHPASGTSSPVVLFVLYWFQH